LTSTYQLDEAGGFIDIESIRLEDLVRMFVDNIFIRSTSNVNILNAKVTFVNNGIQIEAPVTRIRQSVFDLNASAISMTGGDVEIRNIINRRSASEGRGSIFIGRDFSSNVHEISFLNNISMNNHVNFDIYRMNLTFRNNYITDNHMGLRTTNLQGLQQNVLISNNIFNNNSITYRNQGATARINYNNFMRTRHPGEDIFFSSNGWRSYGWINFNNFEETENRLLRLGAISGSSNPSSVTDNIDARNNFFLNPNPRLRICDKNCVREGHPTCSNAMHEFELSNPPLRDRIGNAGIRG
jgi:hypothetical protein